MAETTKIRIRLKAFDHQLLDKSTSDIVETAKGLLPKLREREKADVVVVANFANRGYARYDVGLPSGGTWRVRMNTDEVKYSTDFGGASSADVAALPAPRRLAAQDRELERRKKVGRSRLLGVSVRHRRAVRIRHAVDGRAPRHQDA